MSITANNGHPTIYVNGDALNVEYDEDAPDVSVSFDGVANGDAPNGFECDYCGETFEDRADYDAHAEEFPAHEGMSEHHPWLNSASIDFAEADDAGGPERVDVAISLGDPRGAFVMRVERWPDGELRLSVPTPSNPLLHMPLTPLASDGYYKIG